MSEPHKVVNGPQYVFVVMDGRARFDIDRASVIEMMEPEANYERVWNKFVREYEGYDYCLVAAKMTGPLNLQIFRVIESLEDLSNLQEV